MDYFLVFSSFILKFAVFFTLFRSSSTMQIPVNNADKQMPLMRDFLLVGNTIVNTTNNENVLSLFKTKSMQKFTLPKKSTTVSKRTSPIPEKSKITTPKKIDPTVPILAALHSSQARIDTSATVPTVSDNTTLASTMIEATTGTNVAGLSNTRNITTSNKESTTTNPLVPVWNETTILPELSSHTKIPTTASKLIASFSSSNSKDSVLNLRNTTKAPTTTDAGVTNVTVQKILDVNSYMSEHNATKTIDKDIQHSSEQGKNTSIQAPDTQENDTTQTTQRTKAHPTRATSTMEASSTNKITPVTTEATSTNKVAPLTMEATSTDNVKTSSMKTSEKSFPTQKKPNTTARNKTKKDSTGAYLGIKTFFHTKEMETTTTDSKDVTSDVRTTVKSTVHITKNKETTTTQITSEPSRSLPTNQNSTRISDLNSSGHSYTPNETKNSSHTNSPNNNPQNRNTTSPIVTSENLTTDESLQTALFETTSDATVSNLVTFISSVHLTTNKDGDDTYWPIAMALTIAIPTIIVVGVTITVIHKKRKLERAHSSLTGYITPPMEYDV